MTWLQDIAWQLHKSPLSIGTATTTSANRTIYIQSRPPTTGSCIVLYPYSGLGPGWSNDRKRITNPRLNVLVVSTANDGGFQKAQDIITCLDHITNSTLGYSSSAAYKSVVALQEPMWMGNDENGNGNFTVNFQVVY